jgi:hypothetical protein
MMGTEANKLSSCGAKLGAPAEGADVAAGWSQAERLVLLLLLLFALVLVADVDEGATSQVMGPSSAWTPLRIRTKRRAWLPAGTTTSVSNLF